MIYDFKFKIISKIIADTLTPLMPNLVSHEQRGFIQGRNIKDCIELALEVLIYLVLKFGALTFL